MGSYQKKVVCETFEGKSCVLNIDGCNEERTSYENMSPLKQTNVKQMLNICDSNMISDAAYHELAMKIPELPRTSQIISCRQDLNAKYDIKRTPGLLPGAYLSFKTDLEKTIERLVEADSEIPQPLKVKVSGDGAKVSKVSNFIVMSYSLVLPTSTSQSHLDQSVLSIVNCDETYQNLKCSLGPLLDEINELHKEGKIVVGNNIYAVDILVGGDMKFLQLLLGLNSSIATYACPWCKVPKEDRGDLSLPADHYHAPEQFRTIREMKGHALSTNKQKFGVKEPPLLDIDLDKYVPDELHLLMRVTDVLLRNVIIDAKSKDDYGKITGQPTDNLHLLTKAIQSCGVTFKTWLTKSGELEWTSLNGNDKKKVLRHLPDKLIFCLHEETIDKVANLWREFADIYAAITTASEQDDLHPKIKQFLQNFLELGKLKREGYQPKNVTPYMHVLLYHVPQFITMYGSLGQFSGQGVEKTNDVLKHIHQAKSNKLDATRDALLVRKRIELHNACLQKRVKRKYIKQSESYWENGISNIRMSKKSKIDQEQREIDALYHGQTEITDYSSMTVKELKDVLLSFGVVTKLRKKEKLIALIKSHS